MSLVGGLKNFSAVLNFFSTEDGKIILEYFREMNRKAHSRLLVSNEIRDIFYSQGVAEATGKIIEIPGDIKQHLEDIRTGKIKLNTSTNVAGQGGNK